MGVAAASSLPSSSLAKASSIAARVRSSSLGDETHTLTVPPGTPLLITLRTTTDATDNRPLTLEETRQRADQIQLAYTLH
jgi:DNA-binding GntR family transcriptional regulator